MFFARILLTFSALAYTALPPLVDFNTSHALHPDWTGHARMHMVWLVASNSLLGLLAIYLLWRKPAFERLILAGVISTLILGGFMISALAMPLYDGALTDPGGVAPAVGGIDGNLLTFGLALAVNFAGLIWAVVRRPD